MKTRLLVLFCLVLFPLSARGDNPDSDAPIREAKIGSGEMSSSQPVDNKSRFAPRPSYRLEAALAPNGKTLEGKVTITFENHSDIHLKDALLWLYPNRFDKRPAYLSELNQPYHYPGVFDPASMEVFDIVSQGNPVSTEKIRFEKGNEGEKTFVQIPVLVAPKEIATVTLGFRTKIPKRYGRFGYYQNAVMLDGGFYPMLAALQKNGFSKTQPPRPSDFFVSLVSKERKGVSFINGHGPFEAKETTSISLENTPYLSWFLLKEFYTRKASAASVPEGSGLLPESKDSAQIVYYYGKALYRDRLKTENRWEIGPPGLDTDEARDYSKEILDAAISGIEFLSSLGFETSQIRLRILEIPMRERIALSAPGMILVSDRALRIFPSKKIIKYHTLQILRAMYGSLIEERIRSFEREEDLPWVADAIASYLSDLYHVKGYLKQDFAKEMLKPYSFISEIDRLRWLPQVGFKNAYFRTAYETDEFRDDIRRFAHDWPYGKFVYGKLRSLLGIDSFASFTRAYLGGTNLPFRALSEKFAKTPLDWFYSQWLGPHPQINYKLVEFNSQELATGGYQHTVIVEKEGDTWVKEPVEVLALDKKGGQKVLIWPKDAITHTFTWTGDTPLTSVRVDPRENTYEHFEKNPFDLKLDNNHPGKYRVVFDGFSADLSSGGLSFATAVSARKAHDKRHFFFLGPSLASGLTANFDGQSLRVNDFQGLFLGYRRAFGAGLDQDRLKAGVRFTLVGARIGPRVNDQDGDSTIDEFLPPAYFSRATVSFGYSDRRSFLSPWKGSTFGASLSYVLGVSQNVTAPSLEGNSLAINDTCAQTGGVCQSASASLGATRLISLDGGRVLGLRGSASVLLGNPLGQGFFDVGGISVLKGYPINIVEGRARLLGTVEYRHPILKNLDVNLLEVQRWRGLTAVAWVSGVSISDTDAIFHPGGTSGRSLLGRDSFFADAGIGLRLFGDHLGIDPAVLSFDFATPLLNGQAPPGGFPPLQVFVGFGQNF